MKLDKRIKKVTDIKTPFSEDFEKLSNYIGFNVYGADDVNHFHNLEACFFGALKHVYNDDSNYPFVIASGRPGDAMPFRFMILEKDLESKEKKEKKYRPYTGEEFIATFIMGDVMIFRPKKNRSFEYHVMCNGYELDNGAITPILGMESYQLEELFEDYEYLTFENGKSWVPFGVEVEE